MVIQRRMLQKHGDHPLKDITMDLSGMDHSSHSSGGLSSERLERTLDYIERNLSEKFRVISLAEVACLSPYHFSRCFKESLGTSPHRYLMQRRIARARDLLSNQTEKLPLSALAHALGFVDQSHFTAVFRRETGITPAQFRLQAKQGRSGQQDEARYQQQADSQPVRR